MDLNELTSCIKNGEYVVYDGELVGWCTCKMISKESFGKHTRVLVETNDGTRLNRFLREVNNLNELSPNGCVYFISK